MAEMMWRAAKGAGVGNVFLEPVPVPEPGPHEVLSRTRVSLISRGSELWRRYVMEEGHQRGRQAVRGDFMELLPAGGGPGLDRRFTAEFPTVTARCRRSRPSTKS